MIRTVDLSKEIKHTNALTNLVFDVCGSAVEFNSASRINSFVNASKLNFLKVEIPFQGVFAIQGAAVIDGHLILVGVNDDAIVELLSTTIGYDNYNRTELDNYQIINTICPEIRAQLSDQNVFRSLTIFVRKISKLTVCTETTINL